MNARSQASVENKFCYNRPQSTAQRFADDLWSTHHMMMTTYWIINSVVDQCACAIYKTNQQAPSNRAPKDWKSEPRTFFSRHTHWDLTTDWLIVSVMNDAQWAISGQWCSIVIIELPARDHRYSRCNKQQGQQRSEILVPWRSREQELLRLEDIFPSIWNL